MSNFKKSLTVLAVAIGFGAANAAGVSELADGWTGTLSALKSVVVVGTSLVGLGVMGAGALQLKKHGENPNQVPLSKPLIFLAGGALLFGLGATSNTMQETLFGEGGGRDSKTDIENTDSDWE
tara:strand:+ start:141943 stop:142311 length:369 start_codon:yes stop_codon:yes gene_type:complete